MKYKKKVLVGSFAVAVAAGAISISVASAHFGPNSEEREAVQNAIRNNDFKAFAKAVDKLPGIHKVDTENEFNAMALSYDLRQDKKYKEAREVLERAGIEHPGYNSMRHRHNPDMREAVENNDWNEFQSVTNEKAIAKIVNSQEKFNLFVEIHELHKQGNHGEAREIMSELGLKEKGSRFMK